jgi:hypothetical protein
MILSPDKFGYYTVGDRKTFSKFRAIEWGRQFSKFPKWNFNEDVFDNVNWTTEPADSLWDLYKARAKQIRDEYDYVVLFYSGGSDSHNMLDAWIAADCKIDEIAVTWNISESADLYDHQNEEITKVVIPRVQQLYQLGHDFKFRLIDIAPYCLDLINEWSDDFAYNINNHFSVNNPVKHLLRDKIQAYKEIIASGKKLCFVWGKEKPHLMNENNRYYFRFSDIIDNNVGPYVQARYDRGWYDELFYWTPDMPEICVKQAHTLLNFLQSNNDRENYQQDFTPHGFKEDFGYLKTSVVNQLVYPTWSNNIYTNGKTPSFVYSIRDNWFLNSSTIEREKFLKFVDTYFKKIGDYWANDPEDYGKGLRLHVSKNYWLH